MPTLHSGKLAIEVHRRSRIWTLRRQPKLCPCRPKLKYSRTCSTQMMKLWYCLLTSRLKLVRPESDDFIIQIDRVTIDGSRLRSNTSQNFPQMASTSGTNRSEVLVKNVGFKHTFFFPISSLLLKLSYFTSHEWMYCLNMLFVARIALSSCSYPFVSKLSSSWR